MAEARGRVRDLRTEARMVRRPGKQNLSMWEWLETMSLVHKMTKTTIRTSRAREVEASPETCLGWGTISPAFPF